MIGSAMALKQKKQECKLNVAKCKIPHDLSSFRAFPVQVINLQSWLITVYDTQNNLPMRAA